MYIFDHFPEIDKCIICGESSDGKTILIGIDGTAEDHIEEAAPAHLKCLAPRYVRDAGIIYQKCFNFKEGRT
jgi:hypothetical protein